MLYVYLEFRTPERQVRHEHIKITRSRVVCPCARGGVRPGTTVPYLPIPITPVGTSAFMQAIIIMTIDINCQLNALGVDNDNSQEWHGK